MKGWIPKRLVNYVAGKAPITWAINLQKAADKGLGRESASSPLTAGPQLPSELILRSKLAQVQSLASPHRISGSKMIESAVGSSASASASGPATASVSSPIPDAPTSFEGFPLLSNKDFSDFEFCDEFTVEEMARDGWERLTDEENVQAYARDFGQSGLKQVRAWATIYGYRPEVLFNCIWDFDLSKQWGDACTDDLLAETIVSVCGLGSD
jgi:hypothetical protein